MIGRYRLGPRLGAGGYAVVWLAHDESLDASVAIKVIAENWVDQGDYRERFLTEARLLRRATSSRVVQVFDVGELPDGRPYFVMEHADLGTLEDRIAKGRLPLVEALRITAEIARGAAELHQLDIVHRDLKPSNVLIRSAPDGGERFLIADLGVAKNLTQGTTRTLSVGSAGYMAPEQSTPGSPVDVRADVYSLGALAFDLVTGQQPPTSGPVLPKGTVPDLPEPIRKVLKRALEPDRDRRWPDATSLADRLDALANEFDAQPSPQPRRDAATPRSGSEPAESEPRVGPLRRGLPGWARNRRALLVGGLLVLVLGGSQGWRLVRSEPSELDTSLATSLSPPAVPEPVSSPRSSSPSTLAANSPKPSGSASTGKDSTPSRRPSTQPAKPRSPRFPVAPASVNLAAGRKIAVTSSIEDFVAANVTDGDPGTYWEGAPEFPQRLRVDLGSVTTIGRLQLLLPQVSDWNRRTQTLAVYGSRDGKKFTRLRGPAGYLFDANAESRNAVSISLPTSAQRFVELRFSANSGWKAAQLSELRVRSS